MDSERDEEEAEEEEEEEEEEREFIDSSGAANAVIAHLAVPTIFEDLASAYTWALTPKPSLSSILARGPTPD